MSTKLIPWYIIAAGLLLRLWFFFTGIRLEPFWYDEAFSWLVSRLDLPNLITATGADVHPPLFYLVLKLFSWVYPQELARILPLLFSLGALVVFWKVLHELDLSEPVRLAALALMAINPTQLHYSNELRMYSMLEFLALLQLLFLLRRKWVWLSLATLASIYTHNYGLLFTGAIALIGIARALTTPRARYQVGQPELRGTDLPPLFTALAVPGLLFMPWAVVLYKQIQFVHSGFHWVRPLSGGQALGAIFDITSGVSPIGILAPILYVLFWAGVLLSVYSNFRAKRYTVLAWAFLPWIFAILGSLITPMMLYRGLIYSTPAIYVLVCSTVETAALPWRRVALALLAFAALVPMGNEMILAARGASKNVAYDARMSLGPGVVIHMEDASIIAWSAYPTAGTVHLLLDAGCPEDIGALGPTVRQAMGLRTIKPADLPHYYTLIGSVAGFSTRCHEDNYKKLTEGMETIYEYKNAPVLDWGIYAK